ncbi:MAG: hypothetical protein KY429_07780 [Actinobacteria bacterium]|nr:hypothetical protein [Actinomycetota bacterium]
MEDIQSPRVNRRQFLGKAARASLLTLSLPALLEACTTDRGDLRTRTTFTPDSFKEKTKAIQAQAEKLVGDVLDFQLTSDDWEGVFGFAKFFMK